MKKKNLKFVAGGAIVAVAIGYLAYGGIQKAALYYLTVSELKERGPSETSGEMVRVNGTVLDGSFRYDYERENLHFTITDGKNKLPIIYAGVSPDTFGPGTEVVLEGRYESEDMFQASKLMAKCPSKYEAQEEEIGLPEPVNGPLPGRDTI
ncbi:hypothetical protein LCGC14_2134980 [marine sediment metagenome]|uniref:Cytochrome c-type biogenesis protein CcmE n=1 Tax=marine sediment metagenome TaxID=412755 RepID=A0A0F9E091_9ZZZZ